jgi:hypothetical protein
MIQTHTGGRGMYAALHYLFLNETRMLPHVCVTYLYSKAVSWLHTYALGQDGLLSIQAVTNTNMPCHQLPVSRVYFRTGSADGSSVFFITYRCCNALCNMHGCEHQDRPTAIQDTHCVGHRRCYLELLVSK